MKKILPILFILSTISNFSLVQSEEVIIRTKAEPDTPLVGQKVVLSIDVLAADGWATINSFPSLEIPGTYLHRYETQGTRLNETIAGTSYSGQRYELLLFAYRAGELQIDPLTFEVTVKSWGTGAAEKTITLATKSVVLDVSLPEGVLLDEYLLVTGKIEASQTWSTEGEEYTVGDAINRRVIRKAEDISAMIFAPYEPSGVEGMSCYVGQPEVKDSFNRGTLSGTRIDTLSCILEKPGEYSFEDITFSYWNEDKKEQVHIQLTGRSFVVKAHPDQAVRATTDLGQGERGSIWLYFGTAVVVLMVLLLLLRPKIAAFLQLQNKSRRNSEKFHFKRVSRAADAGGKAQMVAAVMRWLDSLPGLEQPARLEDFTKHAGDSDFIGVLAELDTKADWTVAQCQHLYQHLESLRKIYLAQRSKSRSSKIILPAVGLK